MVLPGTAVAWLVLAVMVRAGVRTATVARQAGLPVAGGQVEPTAVEETGLIMVLSLLPVPECAVAV